MIGLKQFIKTFKEDYGEMYLISQIKIIINELKFAWQRAWRGYDDPSWWNIDDNFIETHKTLLQKLKDNLHGHPIDMTFNEWEKVLNEMIYLINNMDWNEMYSDDVENIGERLKENFNKIKQNKERFFELFSKYFYDLWD